MKLYCAMLMMALGMVFAPAAHAQDGPSHSVTWTTSSGDGKYEFAIVRRNGDVNDWGLDMGRDSLRDKAKEDTLFFRKDGVLYAITDKGTIAQANADIEPLNKLGKQMGELGRQQGEVGKEQGKIGAQQGELGRQMGELGRQLGAEARKGESTAETNAKMKQLGEQMKALGKQMSQIGEKHKPIGAKMKELGHQMGVEARAAHEKIDKLIDEAVAKGLAHKA